MKHTLLIFSLLLLGVLSTGCDSTSSKKSSGSSTSTVVSCNPPLYGQTQCSNYCSIFNCNGSTTSGTTSGSTGSTTGGTALNCYVPPGWPIPAGCPGAAAPINPNWGVQYPPDGVPPTGTCSSSYLLDEDVPAYDTRKATMTIAGLGSLSAALYPKNGKYDPSLPGFKNTTSILTSVETAKTFFMTDSVLKVRFKVLPQPDATSDACYDQVQGKSTIPGYTKLTFTVSLKGVNADNTLMAATEYLGPQTATVNSCTSALDLSYFKAKYPNGVVLLIDQVMANQNCWYGANGFESCNAMKLVRSSDCWALDVEVAADGTKTFD